MLDTLTPRELNNRISGAKTQLKRHAGGTRETALAGYLEQLLTARDRAPRVARLAELDARWNGYIDTATIAAYGTPGEYKLETAHRNGKAKKLARKGLPPRETVRNEIRRLAETTLIQIAGEGATPTARQLQREIDEANALRAGLDIAAETFPF